MLHEDPLVQCAGKDKLPTRALAEQVASRMAHRKGQCISPYKCEHCGFYHVGQLIKRRPGKKWTNKPGKKPVDRRSK
jgi:hypothetical protein